MDKSNQEERQPRRLEEERRRREEAERLRRQQEAERIRQQQVEQERIQQLRREEERQRAAMGPNPEDQYAFRVARWNRISAENAARPSPPRYSASSISAVDRLYQGWRSESDSD